MLIINCYIKAIHRSLNILSYTLLSILQPAHMSSNILSNKENNLEEQEYLTYKPYYVDTIAFKVDNSEQ
jgi:hypothetical protein